MSKLEKIFLIILFVVSAVLRFPQLGYSHLYGDEVKVLYLDKTIPAKTFFMDQRKGPVQFLVVWVVEKFVGFSDVGLLRLPFALAGFLAVFAFYFFLRELFNNWKIAAISASLFSLNGIYIAFSRTIQYQSFLLLFGFTAILIVVFVVRGKLKTWWLAFAGIALSLALLSHYDGVFFLIPIVFLMKNHFKQLVLYIVLPVVILVGAFYVPYTLQDYFKTNTQGYLQKRITGSEYKPNNTLHTLGVYNPFYLSLILVVFFVWGFVYAQENIRTMLFIWFTVTLFLFQFVFLNPGTHIHNYLLPLFILAGSGAYYVASKGKVFYTVFGVIFVLATCIQLYVYLPAFNANYPWKPKGVLMQANKNYNLFLYGFPYYRDWDKIASYFGTLKGVRGFYTNDNQIVAKYYLYKYDVTKPGTGFYPQYYVFIQDSQEFISTHPDYLKYYTLEKTFEHGEIYKLDLTRDIIYPLD